ncbi:MAG: DEAD/DEAH box helicase [bacterium]|nr:DEAD/DEAH box helicase [bacterium]
MIQELADQIWSHGEFHEEYAALLAVAIGNTFEKSPAPDLTSNIRLLRSACHLASSEKTLHRQAAYRIVSSAVKLWPQTIQADPALASVVLSRLGNFPAVDFLLSMSPQRNDVFNRIPFGASIDLKRRELANTIELDDESLLLLTDFQKRFWRSLESKHPVSVTAPTSAGKSFALVNFLVKHHVQHDFRWSLVIVPTRALISQMCDSISRQIASRGVRNIVVSPIPVPPSELDTESAVYVLTQERAQILLESPEVPEFDAIVVDEAQCISDGQRGITLQSVLEKAMAQNPSAKLLFAAPQISNPELFGEVFQINDLKVLRERESPVAQNLVLVETNPVILNRVSLSVSFNDQAFSIADVEIEREIYDERQKLSYLSWEFGRGAQSLVFANGKADCEKTAIQLMEFSLIEQSDVDESKTGRLTELATFIRTHVHPEYALADTVAAGIGFHYGNMPAVVRNSVEKYFSEGLLSHLVCTSTLLQGVNLPARNLFMLKPTRGAENRGESAEPLDAVDFWNLAGRAGRLGKEFEGNVFLIDYKSWQSKPIEGSKEATVSPAFRQNVVELGSNLLQYIEDSEHASGFRPTLESSFAKLACSHLSGRIVDTLKQLFGDATNPDAVKIQVAVKNAIAGVSVPVNILSRNLSVSPLRQQEMLEYLLRRMTEDPPEEFIPVHPLRSEAYASLLRVVKRVHNHFEKKPSKDQSHKFFATMALKWMRGERLPKTIDSYHQQKIKRSKRAPRIATSIRETLQLIENDLRFRYVKFLRCYEDLLMHALLVVGRNDLLKTIPPIHLFLELGASSGTMVSMIGLGFTRTTAGILQEEAIDKNLSRAETLRWLASINWEKRDIPSLCLEEIERVIQN